MYSKQWFHFGWLALWIVESPSNILHVSALVTPDPILGRCGGGRRMLIDMQLPKFISQSHGSLSCNSHNSCPHSLNKDKVATPIGYNHNQRIGALFATAGDGSLVETLETPFLRQVDKILLRRVVRIAKHVPALLTLYYFGLVSMVSMMGMPLASSPATLASVLTRFVGTTTNAQFAEQFLTLVTPANPVFLVWPVIAAAQALALSASVLVSAVDAERRPVLEDDDLAALSLANLAATAWIVVASRAGASAAAPLASVLVLPAVPLLSGFPLRREAATAFLKDSTKWAYEGVFRIFSAFTTIASLLALTVELQHGGRILPGLFGAPTIGPEASALVFLGGYLGIVSRTKTRLTRRIINAVAIVGILGKRLANANGAYTGLLSSPSLWVTGAVASWAVVKLFRG